MTLPHRLARAFGYALRNVKKHLPTLEIHLYLFLPLLAVDAVLDIRANKGQYGRCYARLAIEDSRIILSHRQYSGRQDLGSQVCTP